MKIYSSCWVSFCGTDYWLTFDRCAPRGASLIWQLIGLLAGGICRWLAGKMTSRYSSSQASQLILMLDSSHVGKEARDYISHWVNGHCKHWNPHFASLLTVVFYLGQCVEIHIPKQIRNTGELELCLGKKDCCQMYNSLPSHQVSFHHMKSCSTSYTFRLIPSSF